MFPVFLCKILQFAINGTIRCLKQSLPINLIVGVRIGIAEPPTGGQGGLQSLYSVKHVLRYLCRQMLFGVVEHGGADAILAVGAMEHIHVDTSLASTPESLVVGEVGKSHRLIPQLRVHRHHGCTARQTEYLGMRPAGSC